MLQALDGFFAKIFGFILTCLIKLTGRSNFFIARVSLGLVPLVAATIVVNADDRFIHGITFMLLLVATCIIFRRMTEMEERLDLSETMVVPLPRYAMAGLAMIRPFFVLSSVLALSPQMGSLVYRLLLTIQSLLLVASLYFMTDVRPKTKGMIKRAVAWLRAHRLHIQLRSPSPIPLQG